MTLLPSAVASSLEEKRPWQDDPYHSYELVGYRFKDWVPLEDRAEASRLLEIACQPAPAGVLLRELIKLRALTAPGPGALRPRESELTLEAYVEALGEYPADAVLPALKTWVRKGNKWWPAFAELLALINPLWECRRFLREALDAET
jgi:hypothetical protein